jgi:hypothetical protein
MGKVIELHNTEGGYETEKFKGDEASQENPSFGGYNLLPFMGEEEDGESLPVVCYQSAILSEKQKKGANANTYWL